MPDNIYDIIREENLKKYGTNVGKYGSVLLANLYSDRTHFIYELLQNTEDAYERARNSGIKTASIVQFILFPDRMEVRHSGIPFNENDVRGVCGIVEGTKSDDISQIGKFGIGFKSVYAFTKSPHIYSEEKAFQINNYVHPSSLTPRNDVKAGETLIVIPFDEEPVNKKDAFLEIENRLKDLDIRTILFLKNISEISWTIGDATGSYKKEINVQEPGKLVVLRYSENNKLIDAETWMVFERPLIEQPKIKVEIAFYVQEIEKSNKKQIVPISDTFAVAYFPTSIRTNLKFLIQAPFNTTPARDNIRNDEWNEQLIKEIGILTSDVISDIKKMGFLTHNFLRALPIEKIWFTQSKFFPVFQSVKEKLSGNEALLPDFNNDFTTAKNGLIARGEELRELLSSEQLCTLFKREKAIWLDENITIDRTPDVRKYLIEELQIDEIYPEHIAKEFNKNFIEKQSDNWIIQFYSYLTSRDALWRKGEYSKPEGVFRSKPIIRCEDGIHVAPFKPNSSPNVYLPSKFEDLFPTVKKILITHEKSKEFLTRLGLTEPDAIAGVVEKILPLYDINGSIPVKDNLVHVEWIAKTLKEIANSSRNDDKTRKNDFVSKVKSTAFLIGHTGISSDRRYKKPADLYLGNNYSGNHDSEIFFEGNPEIWFLDDEYTKNANLNTDAFKLMGCKSGIQVNYRETYSDSKRIRLVDSHGYHKQGLYGFDPDCEIDGLYHCLATITGEKSRIIWNLLKQHYDRISGIIETSSRQDFSFSEKNFIPSKMGDLLKRHAWLPNKEGIFFKPCDIQLSDLPEDYDVDSIEAGRIAEKLEFRVIEKGDLHKLLELIPGYKENKELVDEIMQLRTPEDQQKVRDFINQLNEPQIIPSSPSMTDIKDNFTENLVRGNGTVNPPEPTTLTPNFSLEEEETIRQNFGNGFPKRLKQLKIKLQTKIQQTGKILDSIDPRSFLIDQYNGHCQICNTKLDLGLNRTPIFSTYRIAKTKNIHEWTDMEFNVLCLCPNCHALMGHGTPLDIKSIFSVAQMVQNHEVAAEEVTERKGDYYIIKIIVAGKESEIFYSQAHMQKLSAFWETTKEP